MFLACRNVVFRKNRLGRTFRLAQRAVDAVAAALRLGVAAARARAARFAARLVVRNDQCVGVEHRALKARVRAHVFADLLAHEPRVTVGREAIEQNPERFPAAGRCAGGARHRSRPWARCTRCAFR